MSTWIVVNNRGQIVAHNQRTYEDAAEEARLSEEEFPEDAPFVVKESSR